MALEKTILISALLAGLLSLDVMAAFQFMLSRPLVAASLTGLALGQASVGLSLGCLMELIWVGALPVGSVVPPDFSCASIFAVASAVLARQANPSIPWESCVVWALLWSIPVAGLGGWLEQFQRRWQRLLGQAAMRRLELGHESALGEALAASLLMTFARGFAFTALVLAALAKPMLFILGRVYEPAHEALQWMYWLGLLLGFVVVMDQFWERRWLRACAISFVISAVLIYAFSLSGAHVLGLAAFAALVAASIQERRSRA